MSQQRNMRAAQPSRPQQTDDIIEQLQKLAAKEGESRRGVPTLFTTKRAPIDEKIEKARAQKIENDNREKDQRLKEQTLRKLFNFLWAETIVIFGLAFLQGFGLHRFKIDQWSFRIVVTATLGQITAMLTIAVRHLFPKKN